MIDFFVLGGPRLRTRTLFWLNVHSHKCRSIIGPWQRDEQDTYMYINARPARATRLDMRAGDMLLMRRRRKVANVRRLRVDERLPLRLRWARKMASGCTAAVG